MGQVVTNAGTPLRWLKLEIMESFNWLGSPAHYGRPNPQDLRQLFSILKSDATDCEIKFSIHLKDFSEYIQRAKEYGRDHSEKFRTGRVPRSARSGPPGEVADYLSLKDSIFRAKKGANGNCRINEGRLNIPPTGYLHDLLSLAREGNYQQSKKGCN